MQQNTPALSEIDHLTIKLCLANQRDQARELLSQWDAQIDIDTMSFGILRLAPLIQEQCTRYNLTSAHSKRLKVIYKYWWVAYQHRTNQLNSVIQLLHSQQIPTLCFKGVVLSQHYPKPMLRAMADSDILVPTKLHNKALKLLCNNGWAWERPEKKRGYNIERRLLLDYQHGIQLIHTSTDTKLDLHSRVGSHTSNRVTQLMWQHSTTSNIAGVNTLTPPIYLQLYLVVIHAVMAQYTDNLTWVLDAAQLAKKAQPSDWAKVQQLATEEKTLNELAEGLKILATFMSLPITLEQKEKNKPISSAKYKRWTLGWMKAVLVNNLYISQKRRPNKSTPTHGCYVAHHLIIKLLTHTL